MPSVSTDSVASSPRSYVPAYTVDQRNGDQSSPFASFLDNASDTGNQSPPSQSPQTSAGTGQSAASANGSGAPTTSANSTSGSTQGSTAPSAGSSTAGAILHQRAQRLERVSLVRCHVQFRIAQGLAGCSRFERCRRLGRRTVHEVRDRTGKRRRRGVIRHLRNRRDDGRRFDRHRVANDVRKHRSSRLRSAGNDRRLGGRRLHCKHRRSFVPQRQWPQGGPRNGRHCHRRDWRRGPSRRGARGCHSSRNDRCRQF